MIKWYRIKAHLSVFVFVLSIFIVPAVQAEDEAAAPMPVYIELTPDFIVNYTAGGGKLRYIKTKISLRSSSDMAGAIEGNMPMVRDAIVMFLSSRTQEQVSGALAREKTREEAAIAVNEALKEETGIEPVKDVLFASFVTQ
ncbi:flagellar basal body protein FliL [Marinomonas mediterranea]|jgi:Flagellar basal body-associated protein|nr:flagellar basal body protein FliL [Marinomonas mediterranea]WCN15407.1 flagellar basal body protein FliL [Marinomonas mediterranea]WCN19466.1 flagellar basal body protein FliL [Marinomonas mediterranea MMB-1]